MYPTQLNLKTLESQHPDYSGVATQYRKISLLSQGGYQLEKAIREFLPARPSEEPEVYAQRVKKFTYKNVLGDSIRKQTTRMSNGTISVSGFTTAEEDFWNSFRENTDSKGRTENQLVSELFRESLKYQTIYLHADKPRSPYTPRNKAEEIALGLEPRLVLYSALEVISWSDGDDEELEWIKVRQISVDTSSPVQEPQTVCTWTFIDDTSISRYQSYIELGTNGNITALLDSAGKKIGQGDEAKVTLLEEIQHGLGEIPVLRFKLPAELWLGDDCVSKSYEHLRLDCHLFDLLTLAYFQRTYKKVLTPDDNLRETYSEDDTLKPGLEHVLELENFVWSEPKGDILKYISESLDKIEHQIREMVALTGASSQEVPQTQSGVSKELDYFMSSEALKAYGHLITDVLQDAYQLIARMKGSPSPELSVFGLDSFETDGVETLIDRLLTIAQIDLESLRQKLPSTLFNLTQEKLMLGLVGNLTPLQRQKIMDELTPN
jgi:hypothetical protein